MKKNTGNYSSNIVSNILNGETNKEVGATKSSGVINKVINNNKEGNKKVIWAAIALVFAILVVVEVLFLVNKNRSNVSKEKKDTTIYEESYKALKFKEDKDLSKLNCFKKNSNSGDNVVEEDRRIFYFKDNNIETVIYHQDIKLSKEYSDYFETTYKEYQTSLKEKYQYDNVETNITRGDNEILTTVIIYNKDVEKKLGFPEYVNLADAEKTLIDGGYTCK